MKQLTIIYLLLLTIACANNQTTPETKAASILISEVIDHMAFAEKIETLNNEQLIDVRTPEEFSAGAIPNAVNLNFYESNFKSSLSQLNKEQPVLVYCKAGGRSAKAATLLKEMGFNEVYDLKGGYSMWPK